MLKPLADAFGIEKLFVVTLQAISGAGYPGVPAMDIVGNVVPFISGEEEKMEEEPQKLLGKWDGSRFIGAGLGISAHCNRVPVVDGHLECVSLRLKKTATLDEVREALRNFQVSAELASLPTAVKHPVVVLDEPDRPQPRKDSSAGHGMAAVVGRVRECPLLDVKLTLAFAQPGAWRRWRSLAQRRTSRCPGLAEIPRLRRHPRRRAGELAELLGSLKDI